MLQPLVRRDTASLRSQDTASLRNPVTASLRSPASASLRSPDTASLHLDIHRLQVKLASVNLDSVVNPRLLERRSERTYPGA